MKKLQLCISFLFIAGLFVARAQESVTVSGGGALGNSGSVSYSVGQIVYTTTTGSTASLTQGVQQPYEISVVTALNDLSDIQLGLSAYPNPTVDALRLRMNRSSNRQLSYLLYDMSGKLQASGKLANNGVEIQMGHLVPATYLLKVTDNDKPIKIFKIVKK